MTKLPINQILHGDALSKLKELDSESIDCCITSPPYWALRDYKIQGQLGLEPTFNEYITKLVEVFGEVKRVLKKTGALWVVIGDTYNSTKQGNTNRTNHGSHQEWKMLPARPNTNSFVKRRNTSISEKSLCLIPQRFQITMVDAGWICRNTIIWFKPNCMPSSARDRFTVDFEYIFFFTKSPRYYFETQYEPLDSLETRGLHAPKNLKDTLGKIPDPQRVWGSTLGRIKRCVWKIPTAPFSDAHFAVFPPSLVETPLKATCPSDGIVLDPFMGAGTVGLVALQNARNFVGIELNQSYIDMAMKRLQPHLLQTRLTATEL